MFTNIEEAKRRVARATVHLPSKNAQGVLVPGELILTAAHCTTCVCDGQMIPPDEFAESIETRERSLMRAGILAVEPCGDIAALGARDYETFPDEHAAFREFCDTTAPVPIHSGELDLSGPISVYILSHKGEWISGRAWGNPFFSCGKMGLATDQRIEKGTSGGPVIDDRGELVGIVSHTHGMGSGLQENPGGVTVPHVALPGWLWSRISRAMEDE